MGYACPVCADPQADAEHLANHLAFTAMLGDDAHEAWLEEHVPGWAELGPADLAPRVVEAADATDYPQVFEDTTDDGGGGERAGGHGHDHDHQHDHGHDHGSDRGRRHGGEGNLGSEARRIVEEAREMTRRARADGADEGSDAGNGRGDADADGADGSGTRDENG